MEKQIEAAKQLQLSLRQEAEKWLTRAKEKRKNVVLLDDNKKGLIKNIDAYISDTQHFLGKKDYIRAFEAVVWAWSWLEILEELKIIKTEYEQQT